MSSSMATASQSIQVAAGLNPVTSRIPLNPTTNCLLVHHQNEQHQFYNQNTNIQTQVQLVEQQETLKQASSSDLKKSYPSTKNEHMQSGTTLDNATFYSSTPPSATTTSSNIISPLTPTTTTTTTISTTTTSSIAKTAPTKQRKTKSSQQASAINTGQLQQTSSAIRERSGNSSSSENSFQLQYNHMREELFRIIHHVPMDLWPPARSTPVASSSSSSSSPSTSSQLVRGEKLITLELKEPVVVKYYFSHEEDKIVDYHFRCSLMKHNFELGGYMEKAAQLAYPQQHQQQQYYPHKDFAQRANSLNSSSASTSTSSSSLSSSTCNYEQTVPIINSLEDNQVVEQYKFGHSDQISNDLKTQYIQQEVQQIIRVAVPANCTYQNYSVTNNNSNDYSATDCSGNVSWQQHQQHQHQLPSTAGPLQNQAFVWHSSSTTGGVSIQHHPSGEEHYASNNQRTISNNNNKTTVIPTTQANTQKRHRRRSSESKEVKFINSSHAAPESSIRQESKKQKLSTAMRTDHAHQQQLHIKQSNSPAQQKHTRTSTATPASNNSAPGCNGDKTLNLKQHHQQQHYSQLTPTSSSDVIQRQYLNNNGEFATFQPHHHFVEHQYQTAEQQLQIYSNSDAAYQQQQQHMIEPLDQTTSLPEQHAFMMGADCEQATPTHNHLPSRYQEHHSASGSFIYHHQEAGVGVSPYLMPTQTIEWQAQQQPAQLLSGNPGNCSQQAHNLNLDPHNIRHHQSPHNLHLHRHHHQQQQQQHLQLTDQQTTQAQVSISGATTSESAHNNTPQSQYEAATHRIGGFYLSSAASQQTKDNYHIYLNHDGADLQQHQRQITPLSHSLVSSNSFINQQQMSLNIHSQQL